MLVNQNLRTTLPRPVKLVTFSPQYLRLNEPLRFGVRDASGRLLLSAGKTIDSRSTLAEHWQDLAIQLDSALRGARAHATGASRPRGLPGCGRRTR